ncbi:hypothetical protein Tco_0478445 [Tanacetum coccineum]
MSSSLECTCLEAVRGQTHSVCIGLVSMYLMKRDFHCVYLPVASIGGRSLEPATIMSLRIWLLLSDVVIGVVMMNDCCVMNDVIVVKNNLLDRFND